LADSLGSERQCDTFSVLHFSIFIESLGIKNCCQY